jgi:RNA polymerase sigma-70 factor (ECF subfamily)
LPTPEEVDDRSLVEAAQADPARFLELYDRHFHRVYAYALRRTGNRPDAEDVTAEVFHRALVNLPAYEWRGIPFVAWLYRIAAHELSDRRRNAAREVVTQPPEGETSSPDFERRVMLFQLVDRLPADQRRVVELRFGDGKSIQQVAAALGRSEGAVKQLQRRALQNLRVNLEERRRGVPGDREGRRG